MNLILSLLPVAIAVVAYIVIRLLKSKLPLERFRKISTSGREETVSDGESGLGSPFANALISTLENNNDKLVAFTELASIRQKQKGLGYELSIIL